MNNHVLEPAPPGNCRPSATAAIEQAIHVLRKALGRY